MDQHPATPFNRRATDQPSQGSTESVAKLIEAQFVATYLSQSRKAQIGLLGSAALIALIWLGRTHTLWPVAWLTVFAGVSCLRYLYTSAFVQASSPQKRSHRVALTLLANGVLMAIPVSAFAEYSELERIAISIILMATATASTTTTAGYKSIFLAFAIPMLVPLAIAWALMTEHDPSGLSSWGISVLVTFYLGFLVSLGKQVAAVFEQSCRYRFGEQRLNSELKTALEKADESSRAKTHFLAAASHDLRQPLHSINVLVAALTMRNLDADSQKIVNLLDTVNQTLSKQLDGLLDLSKLDAGAIAPNMASHRLDHLLQSHHLALEPVAKQKGVALNLDNTPGASVLTDDVLLRRILSNLTDNALKFTPAGGTITLRLWKDGSHVHISVTDTGIGIPAHDADRVFLEFYQVANAERDRSRGLGLGLSIVQRLCRMLGIRLALSSHLGKGTTVTLTLPSLDTHPVGSLLDNPRSVSLVPGLSVLVIDDEDMVRQSMFFLLGQLGCVVHLADGTEQAVAVARQHAIDIVFSDHRLRGGDSGLKAIEQLKAIRPHITAVLVTGDTAPDRIQDAQKAGVPLLHKPLGLEQVMAVLRSTQH